MLNKIIFTPLLINIVSRALVASKDYLHHVGMYLIIAKVMYKFMTCIYSAIFDFRPVGKTANALEI